MKLGIGQITLVLSAISLLLAVGPVRQVVGGSATTAWSAAAPIYSDRLIVKLRDPQLARASILHSDSVTKLSQLAGASLTHVRAMSGDAQIMRLAAAVPVTELEAIAKRLSADPSVEYAEPDYLMRRMLVPNDPSYALRQWHYQTPGAPDNEIGGANLPGAWDITTGWQNIVVAVIDTGLLPHADIDADILDGSGRVVPGYDFIATDGGSCTGSACVANDGDGRDANPTDPGDWITAGEAAGTEAGGFFALFGCSQSDSSWHGTHVAGTIGALSNNASGVAGINWNSKILPVRVLGKCFGFTSDIVEGMRWAAGLTVSGIPNNQNPAKVLNLSLGADCSSPPCPCPQTYQDAINAITAAGATVVIAAGNSNVDVVNSIPANCSGVITVAATNRAGGRASYSNFGTVVEIAAPGGDTPLDPNGVYSNLDTGTTTANSSNTFEYYRGTSMATPHVAGIASLILSRNPNLTPSQVLSTIQSTARTFPTGTGSDCTTSTCGAGIIDAAAAMATVGDGVPDAFSFVDLTDVAVSTAMTSSIITVTGINVTATVSVTGGQYSIGCTGTFTSSSGPITNGQTVCVRHTSAATGLTATNTVLTIGGVSDTFTTTTLDNDPDAYSFTDVIDVALSTVMTSNTVTITGITSSVPISVSGGQYSIGCTGTFTSTAGNINDGQTVCVRHTSGASHHHRVNTTLTTGARSDTFSSTTLLGPPAGGASGGGGSGHCFIATAAFGSPMAGEVRTLRSFRDRYLMTHAPGRSMVAWYYRLSPKPAEMIRPHPVLRATVRAVLYPLVAWAKFLVKFDALNGKTGDLPADAESERLTGLESMVWS